MTFNTHKIYLSVLIKLNKLWIGDVHAATFILYSADTKALMGLKRTVRDTIIERTRCTYSNQGT